MRTMDENPRSARLGWYLYDFGNTAIEFVVALYLGQWLIVDRGIPAVTYGVLFAAVSFCVVLTATTIGRLLEMRNQIRRGVRVASFAAAALIGSLSVIPSGAAYNGLVLCWAAIGLYLFAIAAALYNSALTRASDDRATLATSSAGTAVSYLGGLIAVAGIAVLSNAHGGGAAAGRHLAFLYAGLFFIAFSAPALLGGRVWDVGSGNDSTHSTVSVVKVLARSVVGRSISLGYVFGNICIVGMLLYLPLFLRERDYPEGAATQAFLWGAVWAGVGAAFNVWLGRRARAHSVLAPALAVCAIGAMLFGMSPTRSTLALSLALEAVGAGAFLGAVRAAFADTFPASQQASGFGLVISLQRLSGGVGGLLVPALMRGDGLFGVWPAIGCGVAGLAGAACLLVGLRDVTATGHRGHGSR